MPDSLLIQGQQRINGEITVSGAKNAALPIIAASLLTDDSTILDNVPNVSDVSLLIANLKHTGKDVTKLADKILIDSLNPVPSDEINLINSGLNHWTLD